ncbi:unnamed protein product, partial [Sphagnum jensenii]
ITCNFQIFEDHCSNNKMKKGIKKFIQLGTSFHNSEKYWWTENKGEISRDETRAAGAGLCCALVSRCLADLQSRGRAGRV